MRLDLQIHRPQLGHQRLIDVQPAGGVENHHVTAVFPGEIDGVATHLHRVFILTLRIHGHFRLLSQRVQLVDCRGTLR